MLRCVQHTLALFLWVMFNLQRKCCRHSYRSMHTIHVCCILQLELPHVLCVNVCVTPVQCMRCSAGDVEHCKAQGASILTAVCTPYLYSVTCNFISCTCYSVGSRLCVRHTLSLSAGNAKHCQGGAVGILAAFGGPSWAHTAAVGCRAATRGRKGELGPCDSLTSGGRRLP